MKKKLKKSRDLGRAGLLITFVGKKRRLNITKSSHGHTGLHNKGERKSHARTGLCGADVRRKR